MPLTLAAVVGPLEGTVVPIRDVLSIGQDPSNSLVITDPTIAPRQCLIATRGDMHHLTHLGGAQSTFVNGRPVQDAVLHHRDHLTIGASVFLILLERVLELTPCANHLVELTPGRVVHVRGGPVLQPLADPSLASAVPLRFPLDAALKVGALLGAARGLAAFGRPLLDLLFEAIPADRAAVLLAEGQPPRFDSLMAADRHPANELAPLQVCRSLAEAALHQGVALMGTDVRVPGALESSGSHAKTVLVAPMHVFGRTLGVIYLEAATPCFEEDHLQLLALIGAMVALALDSSPPVARQASPLHAHIGLVHGMVGDSPAMQEVYRFIARVSRADTTVLVRGESGTGKELVARAIHRSGPRASRPFVAINCAAIPEALLESELFGHEKGAFTGAVSRSTGKLEAAHRGTVFLDEISELPLALQPKLLRVLEEHQVDRLGGVHPVPVDIRIIAATNVDLTEAVAAKHFRADLFYRLNVVSMTLPALRARRDDISTLAAYFARGYGEKLRGRAVELTPEAEALMINYSWPGNVRELKNAIERAVVLGSADRIALEELPEALLESGEADTVALSRYHDAVRQVKRDLILKAVERSGGNLTTAAKQLGLNANYLHRLITNMHLRPKLSRPDN